MSPRPFVLVLLLAAAAPAAAAPAAAAPFQGRVLELGGSDPVAGAFIQAEGLSRAARSDEAGRWRLDLPEGWLRLRVSADGFEDAALALTLSARAPDLPTAWLRRSVVQAQPVVLRARREEAPSRTPLKRAEIRRIAGIGRDPLRALQTLPGVVTPSDFSGQLAVRGGGPQDNAYYLNEVPWPVPFHYGGALSTVHSDLLEGVDLYAAAFPARWGGVDGAILDARTRPARRDGLHGQLDVNLLLSELLLEGPLGGGRPTAASPTAEAGTLSPTAGAEALSATAQALSQTAQSLNPAPARPWGAWMLSGRRSYFELLLGSLVSRFTAVPRFWDLSLLGEADLGPRDKLKLTALATDDLLSLELKPEDVGSKDFEGEFRFRNSFYSGGLNWVHQGEGWRSTLTPYAYQVRFEQSFGKGYGVSLQPSYAGLKEDLRLDLGAHEVGLGGEVQHLRYDVFGYFFRRATGGGSGFVTLSDPAGLTITADATAGAAYLQDRVRLAPGLRANAGLRWQRADRMVAESFDPRLSLDWEPLPRTRASAGWGLYSQFPSPRQLSDGFGNPQLDFNRTEHLVAGVEQGLGQAWSAKLEAYYKTYRDLIVEVPTPNLFSNDGEGFARGLELLLKKEGDGKWFGWLSYSLAESWRLQKGDLWRRYQYDQPHTLTLVGSYNVTPAWSWGAKLNWHSGALVTAVVGRVADPSSNSGWSPVYGDPYAYRLDDYLRCDLRTDYAFRFRGWRLNLYAEVLNVLDRPNPAGLTYKRDFSDYAAPQTVNNLPRLPYVGLGAEF